jgi:hypothetical protein
MGHLMSLEIQCQSPAGDACDGEPIVTDVELGGLCAERFTAVLAAGAQLLIAYPGN